MLFLFSWQLARRPLPLVMLLVAACMPVTRADNEWALMPPASGSWLTPANWSTPLVPLATDNVLIGNGGTAVISTGSAVGKFLFVGGTAGLGAGALEVQGGSLATAGMIVGSGTMSSGRVTQTGGSVTISSGTYRGLQIGRGPWSSGMYDLSGGQLTISQSLILAPAAASSGTFVLSGSAILRTGSTILSGTFSGASATLRVTGGTASLGTTTIYSSGLLDVTGGTASLGTTAVYRSGRLSMSSGMVKTGTLMISSTNGSLRGGEVLVEGGQLMASSLSVSAGGKVTLEDGVLGSTGPTTLSGSLVQNGGLFQPGSLSVTAGGIHTLTAGALVVGSTPSGTAALTISGTLRLDGSGSVAAGMIALSAADALFDQVQSDVSLGTLAINAGTYRMAAGSLAIATGWSIASGGTMDFANGTGVVTVSPGAAVNLSQGTISNSGRASLTILGSETLVILPATFDPTTAFGSFINEGTAYNAGGTLTIQSGRSVQLSGTLTDPVIVAGTLRTPDGQGLTITNGLTVLAGGSANLGSSGAALYPSGISSMGEGSLVTGSMVIASGGTASYTQPAGAIQAAVLDVASEGNSSGLFDLSGGTLTISQRLQIGAGPLSSGQRQGDVASGTFTLRSGGVLQAAATTVSGTSLSAADGNGLMLVTGGSGSLGATTIGSGGVIDVSSGTVTMSSLLVTGGGSGTLGGGVLDTTGHVSVGGSFQQAGGLFQAGSVSVTAAGVHTITAGALTVGTMSSGSSAAVMVAGTLRLDGSGTVTAGRIETAAAGAVFDHVQSCVSVGDLAIDAGTYRMSAGTLVVGNSWTLGSGGTMDFANGNGAVTVSPGSTVNLSQGTIINSGSAAVTVLGSDTFVVMPSGFNPETAFRSFTNEGTSYTVGSTLEILAGRSLKLSGVFADPVIVAGTLYPENGTSISLTEGLTVLDGGSVNLGSNGNSLFRTGSFSMGDGVLATGSMAVGIGANASFLHPTGTVQVASLAVGSGPGSVGSYALSGGALTVSQTLAIAASGSGGRGTFTLSAAGVLRANATIMSGTGSAIGGVGSLLVTGGSASLGTTLIGRGAMLDVSSGAATAGTLTSGSGATLRIGGGTVTTSSLPVSAGGRVVLEGGVLASSTMNAMAGSISQSGGMHIPRLIQIAPGGLYTLTGGTLRVGTGATGSSLLNLSGTFRLDGPGSLDTGKISMTLTSGKGLFDQRQSDVLVGDLSVSYGTYRMSGGTLGITRSWTLGSSGTMNFAGGTAAVTVSPGVVANLSQGTITSASNASLTVLGTNTLLIVPRGFDPEASFAEFSNEGTTYSAGSTLIVRNGRSINLAGSFPDPIDAAGTINLTASTKVAADVSLASSGLITGTGQLTVAGAALRGSGTVATDLRVESGAVAPGFSPGTLTLGGNWTLDPLSVLSIEIYGTNAGLFDRVAVAGSTTLSGSLAVTVGSGLPLGATWTIIDNQSSLPIVGGFGPTAAATYAGDVYTFSIDYAAGTGNDVMLTLTDIFSVPEPSTAALAVAGLAGIGAALRRRSSIA